jgi:hypothetical protein
MQPSPVTFLSVSLEAWLTMLAIIIGPLAALLIQHHRERVQAQEDRRVEIFRTLMANRASRMSQPFVQALNGIEVEFHGRTRVIEAWRSLNEHLYTPNDPVGDPNLVRWQERTTDRLTSLLAAMGESLDYHFDEVTLRRNVYYPTGWTTTEVEQIKLRQAAIKVFEGEKALKVEITGEPSKRYPRLEEITWLCASKLRAGWDSRLAAPVVFIRFAIARLRGESFLASANPTGGY